MPPATVAVLGGGIAGLAAAYRLQQSGVTVTLVEAATRPGGSFQAGEVAGISLDVGADVFLARVPEALDLVAELGLRDQLVTPATVEARVWTRGRLRPLPAGAVLGVPTSLWSLARSRVVSRAAIARAALDVVRPMRPLTADVGVGELVGRRLGRQVVDRLVDPMLGGVYAGRADDLSLDAAMPQLAEVARGGGSLLRGLRRARAGSETASGAAGSGAAGSDGTGPDAKGSAGAGPGSAWPGSAWPGGAASGAAGPVFHSLRGGTAALADALAATLDDVRTRTRVALLERLGRGWRVTLSGGQALVVDAVVVALPAPEAARLLRPDLADVAAELDGIGYADVAVVALAYPRTSALPPGSGFLVPAVEGRTVKAVTFTTQKWPHLDDGRHTVLRCSVGRTGEPPPSGDGALVDAVHGDLSALLRLDAGPVDALVTRWSPALPQYAVGHQQRLQRVEAALGAHPTLALAGAAYEGVGIPACLRSGARAAARLLDGTMRP